MLQIKQKLDKWSSLCICTQCGSDYVTKHYEAKKSPCGHVCETCKDRITNMVEFTQQDLLDLFHYDRISGELRHRTETRRCRKGSLATHPHNQGYLQVSVGRKSYLAHRIVWFMETGKWPHQIDHIDHDRLNNSWNNLREVQSRENQLNTSKSRNNTSGVTGVRILPSGKYNAYITVNRKQIGLGSYATIEEAVDARKKAETDYGFHENHGS